MCQIFEKTKILSRDIPQLKRAILLINNAYKKQKDLFDQVTARVKT